MCICQVVIAKELCYIGASFSLAVGTADAFIAITMDPATVNGVQAVRLGVRVHNLAVLLF